MLASNGSFWASGGSVRWPSRQRWSSPLTITQRLHTTNTALLLISPPRLFLLFSLSFCRNQAVFWAATWAATATATATKMAVKIFKRDNQTKTAAQWTVTVVRPLVPAFHSVSQSFIHSFIHSFTLLRLRRDLLGEHWVYGVLLGDNGHQSKMVVVAVVIETHT